jgi:hypothetical protein
MGEKVTSCFVGVGVSGVAKAFVSGDGEIIQ